MRRRAAFTLVELLVVIGIIAVLISILLPALNKARQAADRTACSANMRQIGISVQMYGNQYKGYCPIGTLSFFGAGGFWSRTTNYRIWYQGGPSSALGCLYQGGIINTAGGRVFFCPANIDPAQAYNTTQNPFPSPLNLGVSTVTGYPCRPVNTVYEYIGGGRMKFPSAANPGPPGSVNSGAPLMPKLGQLKSRAILADPIFPSSANHRTGINVLYADGSAHYVPDSAFKVNRDLFTASSQNYYLIEVTNGANSSGCIYNLNSTMNYGVWGDLDRN